MVEIDAPSNLVTSEIIAQMASDLQAALRLAATDFSEVQNVSVSPHATMKMIIVTMTLEADGDDELDDVADVLLDRAFETLTSSSSGDNLNVIESALVSA